MKTLNTMIVATAVSLAVALPALAQGPCDLVSTQA